MKHFLSSEMENTPRDQALFHIIPAPMEQSVSYGSGTAHGPGAILEASDQLEVWDGTTSPFREGIHTTYPVGGDAAEECIAGIEREVSRTLKAGKIPVTLGGEHTVTLGAARAVYEQFKDSVGLIQIDAHADLRHDYQGNPYSHASVIRKVHELTGWKIFQIGIRAYCKEEYVYQQENGIFCLTGREAASGPVRSLTLPPEFPENIYITFDADGLDSAILPATGTPVPGGLEWYQTLEILESLVRQKNVIGFDFVELAPQEHLQFCDFSAAQMIYNVMGMIQRKKQK